MQRQIILAKDKHWRTLETTLTTKSNYSLGKLTPPIHAASSLLTSVLSIFILSSPRINRVQNSNKLFKDF